MIIVEREDPRHPDATALLQASHALMQELFEPEDNHFLSIDELCVPEVSFFAARLDGQMVGTGALANKGSYGEVKSMFVSPNARGTGVADAMMRSIEDSALEQKLGHMKLETGDILTAAHKLYERHGFTFCGPFGDYQENKSSVFMVKELPE